MGKVMEQGPVLVITFNAQQIVLVKDSTGRVVEGDPVSIAVYYYCFLMYIYHVINKNLFQERLSLRTSLNEEVYVVREFSKISGNSLKKCD